MNADSNSNGKNHKAELQFTKCLFCLGSGKKILSHLTFTAHVDTSIIVHLQQMRKQTGSATCPRAQGCSCSASTAGLESMA